jgi:histidinol-phosphate/aromatic aminotransferase/cobyric acid decarboxylase-like protein
VIPPPGPHGGDGHAVAMALGLDPASLLDLSATLNPYAPDVVGLARDRLDALRRYPDDGDARRLLAAAIGVDPGRIALTNGGSEAIALVERQLGGRVHREPEFALHPRGDRGPVWRSDPNNPTGSLAHPTEVADVWDEAFHPLATGRWSANRGGVVVGSLTKVFACPGLRLGYVIADEVDRLVVDQPQWSVNSLALAVLPELLAATDLPRWRDAIAADRDRLASTLARHGLEVAPSAAPWLLAHAPGLRARLAPLGVVVRDCTSFGLVDHVRIAVPDEHGLARLDEALTRTAEPSPTGGRR